MFDLPRIIAWISDWQELIGALISGACTVAAGFVAYRSVLKQIRADKQQAEEEMARKSDLESKRFLKSLELSAHYFATLHRKLESYKLLLLSKAYFIVSKGKEFQAPPFVALDFGDFDEIKNLGLSATDSEWEFVFGKLSNELQVIHSRSERYVVIDQNKNDDIQLDDREWYDYARPLTLCMQTIEAIVENCRGQSKTIPTWPSGPVESGLIARPLFKQGSDLYDDVIGKAKELEQYRSHRFK